MSEQFSLTTDDNLDDSASPDRTPEEIGIEIAKKHIDAIPEDDRRLASESQVYGILVNHAEAKNPNSHTFSLKDKFSNPPGLTIGALIMGRGSNYEEVFSILEKYATDPFEIANETDKLREYASKSGLPENVQRAQIAILLQEGIKTPSGFFKAVVDRAKAEIGENEDPEVKVSMLAKIYRELGTEAKSPGMKEDVLKGQETRQVAMAHFLEGIYPNIFDLPESVLFAKYPVIGPLTTEEMMATAQEYKEITGDDQFDSLEEESSYKGYEEMKGYEIVDDLSAKFAPIRENLMKVILNKLEIERDKEA